METLSQNIQSEASPNTSNYEEIALMQMQLQRAGWLKGDESPERLRNKYQAWKKLQDDRTVIAEADRQETNKADMKESVLNGLRARLRRARIDPASMDEEAMRAAIQKADEESKKFLETEKRDRQLEQVSRRIDHLYTQAACPPRHTLNLDLLEDCQNNQFLAVRDLLLGQAQYANGYLVALLGKRGLGKTEIGVSIIHECCKKLFTCRYIKLLDLFRDFRRAYTPVAKGKAGESEEDIIQGWVSYDLLVIDECHQRGETQFEQNTLVNLLDRRYDAMRCTILLANQDKDEFAQSMGDSVVSRVHETGEAIICDWPTYRTPGNWKQSPGSSRRAPSGEIIEPRTTIRDV